LDEARIEILMLQSAFVEAGHISLVDAEGSVKRVAPRGLLVLEGLMGLIPRRAYPSAKILDVATWSCFTLEVDPDLGKVTNSTFVK